MESSKQTDIQVQLKGVHLCCEGCVDAVASALERMPGVAFHCDMERGTVAFTAKDTVMAQQALDAIADAGLHGNTGSAHLAMKAERNIPPGRVQKLKISGIHNCCRLCTEAIKGALQTVSGVTGDTVRPGETRFEITGDFAAGEVLNALNAAGFHAKVTE